MQAMSHGDLPTMEILVSFPSGYRSCFLATFPTGDPRHGQPCLRFLLDLSCTRGDGRDGDLASKADFVAIRTEPRGQGGSDLRLLPHNFGSGKPGQKHQRGRLCIPAEGTDHHQIRQSLGCGHCNPFHPSLSLLEEFGALCHLSQVYPSASWFRTTKHLFRMVLRSLPQPGTKLSGLSYAFLYRPGCKRWT